MEEVLYSPGGVAEGLKPGTLVLDMSSISPTATVEFARRIEALGCDYLDARVSGGEVGAKAGTMMIMVGGSEAALERPALTPDYALGGHTASLGLCWMPAGTLPRFPDGMVIGQHGSWNRSTLSGYKLVFVPFEGGRPS